MLHIDSFLRGAFLLILLVDLTPQAAAQPIPAAREVLARLWSVAESRDTRGAGAPAAYLEFAEALAASTQHSAELPRVLRRGFQVSLREGDLNKALWFRGRLDKLGESAPSPWPGKLSESGGSAAVPGGLGAALFAARAEGRGSPESFFADYCRAVLSFMDSLRPEAEEAYRKGLLSHFQRIRALDSLGSRRGSRVHIEVSIAGADGRRRAESVLALLGWRLALSNGRVEVRPDARESAAGSQETASALGIDEVAMRDSLEAGRTFSFAFEHERAALTLGENAWRNAFYAAGDPAGGFAEAALRDPRLAKAYVGLSALDPGALQVLLEGFGLKRLVEEHADLLYRHGTALSVLEGSVVVPGGRQAAPVWIRLTGADPGKPIPFFRALFQKDSGKLLAYFHSLSELDLPRQRFFTKSVERAAAFYALFKESTEVQAGGARVVVPAHLAEFLRDLPVTGDGKVRFPGGPGIWIAPWGTELKPARAATSAEEDRILLRIAGARRDSGRPLELESFLALLRIDAHRPEPLTAASAWLLKRHFAEYGAAYPYFQTLTSLGEAEFQRFFEMGGRLRLQGRVALNDAAGEVHALLEMLCLAQKSGALHPPRSAALFRLLCERFAAAAVPPDYTNAALDLVRAIIAALPESLRGSDPDQSIQNLLLAGYRSAQFDLRGARHGIDPGQVRLTQYLGVMELQNVTQLQPLMQLQEAALGIARSRTPAVELSLLESAVGRLPVVAVPESLKPDLGRQQSADLRRYRPAEFAGIVEALRRETAAPAVDRNKVGLLARRLLGAAGAQVRVALTGIIYAYYLRPEDLLISEDGLFLRKHQFVNLENPFRAEGVFQPAELYIDSRAAGSYLVGGFAAFGDAIGQVAVGGASYAGNGAVLARQVGSLRTTDWRSVEDRDVRVLGLTVLAAKEWLVQSALDPVLRSALAEDTLGLLSFSRRGQLLESLRTRDWRAVWRSVTLSDLYFLGARYLARFESDPVSTPVTLLLRRLLAGRDQPDLPWLGVTRPALLACGHSHLVAAGPYEAFERYTLPARMAGRVDEFPLYLAGLAGQMDLPAAALGIIAEPLARDALLPLHMLDHRDWRAVLAAFANVHPGQASALLGRP